MRELINACKIKNGDFVLIAADFRKFLRHKIRQNFDIKTIQNDIVLALKDAVGVNGTLAFQTFNWDFCKGIGFDIKNTPSMTGGVGNLTLKMSDFIRTKHPIYSFCVYGKFKDDLKNLNNTDAFGNDSPFAFFHQKNAKMIVLDLELNHSFTFVHYAEQKNGVSYRFIKNFTAPYTDENGVSKIKTYSMFVRKDGVLTELSGLETIFINKKAMKINKFYESEAKIINLSKAYEIIADDIKHNKAQNLHKWGGVARVYNAPYERVA